MTTYFDNCCIKCESMSICISKPDIIGLTLLVMRSEVSALMSDTCSRSRAGYLDEEEEVMSESGCC
jgi:hypothetical protein